MHVVWLRAGDRLQEQVLRDVWIKELLRNVMVGVLVHH